VSGAIEFVVREVGLGSGHRERCVDPVINGERLRDALARVEGRRSGYERALAELTTVAGGLRDAPE
jgi:hypothetical protein